MLCKNCAQSIISMHVICPSPYQPKCLSIRDALTSKSYSKALTSKSILKLLTILCFWLMVSKQKKFEKHCFTGFMLISVMDRRHGQTNSRFCYLKPSDMDFSENYTYVEQDEIQSAHWNKNQICLYCCLLDQ